MKSDLSIVLLDQTESTNALALEAIDDGEPEGRVFVADHQTAGRGRRESGGERRRWFSPAGQNLYLSVVVRPDVAVERAAALTIAVGVELVALLREETEVEVTLKWPNDLYVGDRKLGGILTEAVTDSSGLRGAAVGLGLNINNEAKDFPSELREIATSLRAVSGRRFDRLSLALSIPAAIVDASDRYSVEGLEPFVERIGSWDYLQGRRVSVVDNRRERSAVADGIGADGGLIVEFDDGSRREIVAGEVAVK